MKISDNTIKRLERSRSVVDRIVDSKVPTYGINTGSDVIYTRTIRSRSSSGCVVVAVVLVTV